MSAAALSMERIRLLLLDDHILFRESLSRLLASERDFDVIGQCGTSEEALAVLSRQPVDVVLLDFDLGQDNGNRFISSAHQAGYAGKILAVTAATNAAESSMAVRLGVSGIFLKQNSPGLLVKVIRLIAGGELWVDQRVIQLMADGVRRRQDRDVQKHLTEREQQVLLGIADGLSNSMIATQLGVSVGAIKATLQRLFQKTDVRTRSQLVRIAIEGSLRNRRNTSQLRSVVRKSDGMS